MRRLPLSPSSSADVSYEWAGATAAAVLLYATGAVLLTVVRVIRYKSLLRFSRLKIFPKQKRFRFRHPPHFPTNTSEIRQAKGKHSYILHYQVQRL